MDNKIVDFPYKELRHAVSTPFILGMAVPLVILDFFMEIYHHVAFPLYNLPLVNRSEYIKIDRQKLPYLSNIDKVWCAYCGYANGLLAYAVEIAGRTEKYWCGIKHAPDPHFHEPAHHKDFIPYGDEMAYLEKYEQCKLAKETPDHMPPSSSG